MAIEVIIISALSTKTSELGMNLYLLRTPLISDLKMMHISEFLKLFIGVLINIAVNLEQLYLYHQMLLPMC